MLYILLGPDDFSIGEWLSRARKGLGDESVLEANTTVFDGQQVTPEQLGAAAGAMPFLAEKRLIIVNGLLERFEPKGRPGAGKGKAAAKENGYAAFSQCLENLPPSSIVVLADAAAAGNKLYRELAPLAEVKSFPRLKRDSLNRWINKRVKEEGGRITPGAVELLAQLVGGNLWIMAGEVSKLSLYASGDTIDEEMVKRVVGYSQQATVFAMVDAILEFKARAAQKALGQLLRAGGTPSYLLYMLTRQVRLILRAKELLRRGRPEKEIQEKLGLVHDFVWRKTLNQAAGYSIARLKEIYTRL
ncbi:MAG: DNA polymerase III subunit delta, partial [Dehalococcoidales bacterium]